MNIEPQLGRYFKIWIFPNGLKCPKCEEKRFHPKATILPELTMDVDVVNNSKQTIKDKLWVARSECLNDKCDGILDWTFHPDRANGCGNEFINVVDWSSNPLGLIAFKDFPRSIIVK